MPNFDNNLNSPLFNNTSSDNGFNHPIIPTFRSPDVNPSFFNLRMPNVNSGSEEQSANPNGESPLFKNKVIPTRMLPINTASELYENRRYPGYSKDIIDIEDSFANKQSTLNKAFNGIAKGGLLAGTTIVGSGGMLYGTVKSLFTGRMADIWDNEIMRGLDEINTEVDQNYLPNYYTNLEKNSAWYSPNYWFTANFLFDTLIKNSGFAVGAMVSGNIANGILGGLGKAAGGLALRGALAAESSQAFKLFSPLLRNAARAFSLGKNLEVASALENGLSSMADITSTSGKLSNLLKSSNFYTKLNDVGRRGAIAAYSSAGESSFEALQTMNEFRNTLIEDYKQKNGGLEPEGEALDKINLEAEKVGKVSFLGNMALLGITEYAQLPYLMGSSYKNSKKIANSLLGKTDDVILSDAKYAVKTPKTRFGKLYSSATNIGKYVFDPKESAQEISQFALQVGTQNYFRKAYQGDEVSLLQDGLIYGLYGEDESGEGVGALNTKEGIIGGITGGITGGLMQSGVNFSESKQKKINTSNFINKLNNAPTFKEAFKYKSESAQRGIVLQDQYNDAVISGDKLEALDLKQDALINYLSPRIKYGRFDMVLADLAEFRAQGQTEEGLASLKEQGYVNVEDNISNFQERVSQIEEAAKKLNNIYETLNVRYSGIIDKEGNKKYSEYAIDKLAYANYKIDNYESRIPQLNSSLLSKGIDVSSVLETVNNNTKFNSEVVEQILDDVNNRNITSTEKDEIKTEIKDVIELGLRKQKFIDDFNNIVNSPEKYDDFYNTDYFEKIEVADINDLNNEKIKLSVGEEYSIDSPIYVKNGNLIYNPKIKILSSALDKELEVQMPNGETLFISKDKLEKLKINPNKKENSRDKDILVSAIKKVLSEDENIKGLFSDELINYVNVLNDSKITFAINKEFNNLYENIRKQEEEKRKKQEQLLKTKDVISKEQEELETASGTTETINENQVDHSEGKLKEASILFKSSITESEDWDNVEQSAPHIKRARIFLNNVARFKNRKNYKVILITPNNAKTAGLEGIVQLSYKRSIDTPLSEIEDATNPENGFMAQVFVYIDKSGSFFVNEKGEKIGKVGKQLENIESSGIVFQTMPSATLYNSKGTPRFRKNEEEKANRELAAYKIFREQKFANEAIGQAYPFRVSRGVRRKTEIKEDNHIGSILGKDGDKIISSVSSLLEVVTTGKISFNGELISFPKGTVVFKYGDTLDFANNKPLTEKQAASVYAVIEKLAENVLNGKSIQGAYSNFLQNILYWKSKAETTSPSQIRIDVNTMSLHLGKESFPISEISQRKDEIINALKQAFITVNDKTLKEGVNKTFIEYALNAQGELKPIIWKNYQEYLLSDKYPNGDKRDISETPLITHAPKPTELFPSSYVQRYSTIEEGTLEFPYELIKEEPTPVKQETPTEVKKEQPKQNNKYNLTPGIINGYKLKDGRDILFTGEMTPEGPSISIQQTSVFNDIVANKATINGIRLSAEQLGTDTSKMSDVQVLDFYLKLLIAKDIENQNEQQQTTQSEQTQETAQGQTTETNLQSQQGTATTEQGVSADVESKKADIERENEILGNRFRDSLEKLKSEDILLAAHFLMSNKGLQNEYGSDTSLLTNKLKIPFSEAEKLVQQHLKIIKPINWKLEDEYDTSILDEKVNDNLKEINAKYDIELKELKNNNSTTSGVFTPTTPYGTFKGSELTTESSENPPVDFSKLKTKGKGKGLQFRKLGISDSERMTEEDIKEFKKWHAENVPNIPFEILEQMIVINSTESAWGVFENGVAKFVKGGLKGTEYHEVFEAIWANLLTETEKKNLLKEFKAKKGTFIDRQSGKEYSYNDDTLDDNIIKERIADDFADYRLGKIKNSSIKGMIKEFFNRIMNFFKSFITKQPKQEKSLKEKLFDEINRGKFKNKKIVSENKFKNVPVKSGVKELFNENSELSKIGTQQQYSAYLDTIFPDSKVKDIVYHGTDKQFDIFDVPKKRENKVSGIYFSTKKEEANVFSKEKTVIIKDRINSLSPAFIYELPEFIQNIYFNFKIKKELKGVTPRVISAVINTKGNPNIIDVKKESLEFFNTPNKETSNKLFNKLDSFEKNADTVIYKDYLDYVYVSDVVVVKNPNQIHTLGSKQDIEGFREFVSKNGSSVAPQYRIVEGLSEEQVNDLSDDIIGTIAELIYGREDYTKQLLFNPEEISGKGIFAEIKRRHQEAGLIDAIGENRWNQIKERAIDKLRTLGVSFEEDVDINDENANQKEYEREAFVVDWKKTSSAAIRFSLATIPQRVQMNQTNSLELVFPDNENDGFVLSESLGDYGGYKLVDFSRVFTTLMDKLSNTNSPQEFVRKLVELAEIDTTYLSVFARLGGNLSTKSIDFANMTNKYDVKYFTQFYNLFSKQKPETLIQYINDGEVYSNNANLFSAVTEITNGWINNIKALSKSEDSLISYDRNQKIYKIDSEKIKSFPIRKASDRVNLLNAIGINFDLQTYNLLSDEPETIGKRRISQKEQFDNAVDKISEYLGSNPDIMTLKGNTLGISGPLRTLSRLYIVATNPNQDSTFFGVNNQRKGSYAENNAASFFENDFNESETIDELLEKRPELNGYFSKGSQILKKGGLFFDEDGNRIAKLKLLTIEGLKNIDESKSKGISKLTLSERAIQEINQNINGNYYVLVPGDGSTEWMMNLGNIISFEEVEAGVYSKKLEEIFINGYLMDEVNLALFGKNETVTVKKKSKELRFMKDILSDKHVKEIEDLLAKDATTLEQVEKYIKDNKKELLNDVEQFVKNVNEETFNNLTNSSQIEQIEEDEFSLNKFDSEFIKEKGLSTASKERVDNFINFLNLNYIINNIEYHKFIFGDPYQYKIKGDGSLDETKRIKMYLSPRRRLFDLQEFNDIFNIDYNKVGDIELDEKDPTYHTFKSYTKTATLSDIEVNGSISRGDFPEKIKKQYVEIDETDAMSWIEDNTYREVNIKKGQWSDEAEKWHQWQMAFTRQNYPEYTYTNEALKKHDEELVNTPEPEHHIEQIKPIVSGNKYGSKEINPVGDKLSQMPIYYSMVKGTNLEKLYIKMKKENLGYVIVQTGRKFGSEGTNPMYVNGKFNEEKYTNTIDVAWDSYGIIVETATEGDKKQTRGSQIPKVITMDMFSNGEVSEGYNKEEVIAANKEFNSAEEDLAKFRYKELLDRLGIIEEDGEFISTSNKTIAETLQEELLRRDASENVKDSLKLNEEEDFEIPFEASPSYEQIRSILYSMVNKSFISPKMNGAPHVQAPSTMFEQDNRILAIKENGVYRLIVTQKQYNSLSAADKKNAIITPDTEKYFNELGEEQKKTAVLTDNTLKFYTKEQPWCEIMLPHWFKDKFSKKRFKTDEKSTRDEKILNYLNSKEGQRILSGMAFRIPTQALSSIERFKVKNFLPQYMGHTVIVPTEITKKSGSDFDIDKLNIYLKSIYVDNSGNPRLIEYKGSEEETKQFYAEVFDKNFDKKISNKSELLEAIDIVLYNLDDPKDLISKHRDYIMSFRDKFASPMDVRDYLEDQLNKMTEEEYYNKRKEEYINRMYKSALENRYYEALERLFELQPIEKILSPVDDGGLEDVSKNLDKLRNDNESTIKGRLLNRNYMSNLRHAFIVGKAWVGIAAVNITGLSLRQKTKVYLDPNRISLLGKREQDFVKNLDIALPHNTIVLENGKKVVSLSGLKTADGTQYLSNRFSGYATAFVDIAANPFISKIIKSDIVISTFMLLEAVGAGNTGVYFLNQPIIEEYLKILDKEGTKSVLNENNIKKVKELFPANANDIKYVRISPEGLEQNIADYYKNGKLRPTKNAEQQKILDEFIKYKILADQLFEFTQATNYDTTRLTGVDSLYKKELLTKKVKERNIIANIDGVLNETFIGNLTNLLSKSTQAMGTIFKLDEPKIRAYVLDTVKRYATKPFMANDDYERITNLIRSSFLDYIIQSHSTLNKEISDLLLNESTNIATQLELMKSKYPDISILQDFEVVSGNRENSAKTVKLKVNLKGDVFAENHYIAKMNELRDYNAELNKFYNDLIKVAILQGNSQSAISFKNIIPVQDYAKIITPIVNSIIPGARLDNFTKSMFERNNFTNENVFVPAKIFYAKEDQYGKLWLPAFDFNKYKFNSDERQLLKLSEKFNFTQVSSDFVKVPRVFKTKVGVIDELGQKDTQQRYIDILSGKVMRSEDWKQAKEKGDQSLNDMFYYKKVYINEIDQFGERVPLKIWNGDEKVQAFEQVYKLMNVYGDSFRAVEYPSSNVSSIFNNGSIKTKELTDEEIVSAIKNPGKKKEIVTDSLKDEENSLSLPTEEDLGLNTDLSQDDFKC